MKTRIAVASVLLMLGSASTGLLAAGVDGARHHGSASYRIQDLGTLGGTRSFGSGANKRGTVTGTSLLTGNQQRRAFIWRAGEMEDLGTLGGGHSSNSWPPNDRGEVAGNAELATADPLSADICGFGTDRACRGYVWRDGSMRSLPSLGGSNSLAAAINNRGQVFGAAETEQLTDCGYLPRQFLPVVWERFAVAQVLPLVGDDQNGSAYTGNRRGQIIGFTERCNANAHAVMWQDGVAIDLGNLGGTTAYAFGINERGQVTGFSTLADESLFHAFLWKGGAMADIGTLPGDVASIGNTISDDGVIVGDSFDSAFNSRAFVWKDGRMTDLNTLVSSKSPLNLTSAIHINARGQITGTGRDKITGVPHAFLATPVSR